MKTNQSNVTYRSFQPQDMEPLAQIIVDTWQFGCYFKRESAARHFGCAYLAECLIHATFSQVAVVDGRAVGIIIGADYSQKRTSVRWLASTLFHGICLAPALLHLHGRPPIKYNKIMGEMDRACPEKGSAEIALFIMSPDCRGLGIGSALFQSLKENFKSTHVERCYVHTDTVCSYRFYEAQGMELLQERKTEIAYAGQKNVTMLLYGAKC